MNWKIVVLPDFQADLQEAADWYEQKLEGLGTRFAGEVLEVWADVAVNPLIIQTSPSSWIYGLLSGSEFRAALPVPGSTAAPAVCLGARR